MSTNVDVHDGETIVIGELVQQQNVEQFNRVPGLSSVPLLGRLFQTRSVESRDVEVAIFISPRIVGNPVVPTGPHLDVTYGALDAKSPSDFYSH